MRVSSFSIIIFFLVISLLGIFFLPILPLKLSPSKSLPQASISFSMRGSSSKVIEAEVTSKIEAMVCRVKGVSRVRSTSHNGWGQISVEIDKYADINVVRFELATTVRQLWSQLPEGVSYPNLSLSNIDENRHSFMSFNINSITAPHTIMHYVEKSIKSQLVDVKGIYKIDIYGATPMEWQLFFDAELLESLEVSVNDISAAVQQELKTEFLGMAPLQNDNLIRIVLEPKFKENPDWSQIQVKNKNNKIFQLTQLVKINRQERPASSYFRINGLNSIYMNIYADKDANQLNLSKKITRIIQQINLPHGYEIHKTYDSTEHIKEELDKIYFRSILTLIILLLFVLLISRRWKYLLLITLSLLSNLSIALIFYYLFKVEIQLYSLAGITISMTLIIDNTIVMADHLLHRKNLLAFPAILAATLTTMAALAIVFFLSENIRLNLLDFSYVIIINLCVSILIALFLVPALIIRININLAKKAHRRLRGKRRVIKISYAYSKILQFLFRYKVICLVIILLTFGLPVFLLPPKIEQNKTKWQQFYNSTIGSDFYQKKLKDKIELILGGSLRAFVKNIYVGSYFTNKEKISITMYASAPNGATINQMNDLIKEVEIYLSGFKEIQQFQTNVSARNASIRINFKKEYEHTGFPNSLNSMLISKAIELGGATWKVEGIRDKNFNNDVRESTGSYKINIYGYNYDDLTFYAEKLKKILLQNRRIKQVAIASEFSVFRDDYFEYEFSLNKEQLNKNNVSAYEAYRALSANMSKDYSVGKILYENKFEDIKLTSIQSSEYDVWNLQNKLLHIGANQMRLSQIAHISKIATPQKIIKENQQYQLSLQYEYIGSTEQGYKLLDQILKDYQKELPLGYSVSKNTQYYNWQTEGNKQYLLLVIIIIIIMFICSILFNSIKQSISIISIIPISYIGVFLTFNLFSINFDQGGFASLILLCGITVNASIYIVNEMNNIRKQKANLPLLKIYTKAWNAKITPIFLTTVSTILGFIPFVIKTESFWYPLAAGTIGGLVFSWIGILFYLPLILLKKSKLHCKSRNI